jgi:DNA primase catalytic core
MPRIPDSEVARLKQAISLQRLAELKGCQLERAGANEWKCRCIFHTEETPSLTINTAANVFHCFGCSEKGDVIAWVRRAEGLSFPDAVAWLQDFEGNRAWRGATAPRSRQRVQLDCPISDDAQGEALFAQVAAFYHHVLMNDPLATSEPARLFLQRRKIWDTDTLKRLSIGFDDRSLGPRLPHADSRLGKIMRSRLEEIGLYRSSGHAHFVGCITFPIEDPATGAIVSMYGRRAQKNNDGARHFNLAGERRGIWNAAGCRDAAAAADGRIILCEAIIDALTFVAHGFPNVTACLGTNGYTDDIRSFLLAHAKEVLIAFDRDDAGDAAFGTVAEDLMDAGITCHRVQFPPGKDANDVAVASDNPRETLSAFVRNAVWLGGAPWVAVPEIPKKIQTAAAEEKEPEIQAQAEPISSSAAEPLPHGIQQDGDTISATFGERSWWARGWKANTSYDRLRVALRVRAGERVCGDNVDLASLKQRSQFIDAAALELKAPADALKDDLSKLWLGLESLQDRHMRDVATPTPKNDPVASITPERRDAALAFLKDPNLLARIQDGIAACGLVGEADNALVAYLAAISRKLHDPLAVLVQASSAAGKSSLQDAVLSLVPEEDRFEMTAVSSRALFYAQSDALKHKALSIAEQEGAESATYSLKLMQSAGKLSIMVPVKDPETNEMTTQTRTVEGPVALFLTTTAAEINDELQNRFLVLTVDESAQQTRLVHVAQRQRETRDGYLAARRAVAVRQLHHDAQRLLENVVVFNPLAPTLSFIGHKPRTRRDHAKFLRMIRVIAFLRQHQRPRTQELIDGQYVTAIEATAQDVADAQRLAESVIGRGLDELAPQTRRLLDSLRDLVGAVAKRSDRPAGQVRLTRRQMREHTGWSYQQIHTHLTRLVNLEYILVHRGPTTCSQLYELSLDAEPTPTTAHPAEVNGQTTELYGRLTGVLSPFHDRFTGPEIERDNGENRGDLHFDPLSSEKCLKETGTQREVVVVVPRLARAGA